MSNQENQIKGAGAPENAPKIGDRIALKVAVDRYPFFVADARMQGTITEVGAEIWAQMDERLADCEEWENCIVWSDWMYCNEAGVYMSALEAFNLDAAVIG